MGRQLRVIQFSQSHSVPTVQCTELLATRHTHKYMRHVQAVGPKQRAPAHIEAWALTAL